MKISKKFIRRQTIGIATLAAGSFLILFLFDSKGMFSSFSRFFCGWSYGAVYGFCFWQGNEIISRTAGKRLDWRKNAQRANSITVLILFFHSLIISISVPYVFFKYVFDIPADKLVNNILGGSLLGLTINFAVLGMFYSRFLANYWMQSIQREEQLKQENLISKYEALKNQVNPHFLFNSLNTLAGIVEKNSEIATQYIKKLSDIYRYVLEQKDKETVSISEELQFAEDYIYLQKMRYGAGLNFISNIRDRNGQVAPLALQILIENAIKHNIIADDQPLYIELLEDKDHYVLKNNLQHKKTVHQNSRIGLDNLWKRYEFLSSGKVEIQNNGNEFIVRLPIIKSNR